MNFFYDDYNEKLLKAFKTMTLKFIVCKSGKTKQKNPY